MKSKTLIIYEMDSGRRPFQDWLLGLRSHIDRARIQARLLRISAGNMGDAKSVGAGVHELRFFFGPGYRVYFGESGGRIVVLLCGGQKGSQATDIRHAKTYWADFLRRNHE